LASWEVLKGEETLLDSMTIDEITEEKTVDLITNVFGRDFIVGHDVTDRFGEKTFH
jgi:hypothetical protein